MARPKKDPKSVKGEYLRIPVTTEQKRLIIAAAQKAEGDMAPWARRVLLEAAESVNSVGPQKKK